MCESDSWCTYTSDGNVVKCMRFESPSPCESSDGGWFHFDKPLEVVRGAPTAKPEPVDAEPIARKCYEDKRSAQCRASLADQLGVTERSLDLLRVGVGQDHDCTPWYSFPSRDGTGKVIGITRRYFDGTKKTYRGTSNGIFYTPEWYKNPGIILIVEGASDVAAAESLGVCAIGRSSNIGGVGYIQSLLAKNGQGRKVVVLGERDEKPHKRGINSFCPKECKGCAHCYPGLFGAKYVASQLGVGFCMPPYKDLRETVTTVELWPELLRCV